MPVTWLKANACAPIRLRTLTELVPPGAVDPEEVRSFREEAEQYKGILQIARKQRDSGVWASNMLGTGPSKALGIKDVGTVAQYRRLIEMGVAADGRPIQLASRVFFRLLSRDDDPKLLFEFQKLAKTNPQLGGWARAAMRDASAAALAHAGFIDDPRVRGAADRIVRDLSQFLRSDAAEKPIITKASRQVLNPEAHPPTLYSVAILAYMPGLQRERASFLDRLVQFLTQPAPKKTYVIQLGKKNFKPTVQLLGEPILNDSAGRPKDLPFALYWMELMARLNRLEASAAAKRALARLLKDCDDDGVWNQKNMRTFPKSPSGLADFALPLEIDGKSREARRTDVTFRLARLAKWVGVQLDYT